MSSSLYRQVLETYLENKEADNEPLPGIRGRGVSYRGISVETGIPRCYMIPGSELRLLIDTAVGKLGVANGSSSEQPRRVWNSDESAISATYDDLKTYGVAWLKRHDYAEKTIASYLSHLNAYMRHLERSDTDLTAEDFGAHFDDRLGTFLRATERGKVAASALRSWSKIHYELHQRRSLPAHFAPTLTELVTRSGRTLLDIVRSAGIKNHETLAGWMLGESKPADPEQVARLEAVLKATPGALSSKLIFHRTSRAKDIPKEWWPELWRKYYNNYKHQRDRVASSIPEHLLSGPLEELKPAFDEAVRRVLAGEDASPYRQKLMVLRQKVYRLKFEDWPSHLKDEFQQLEAYKTAPDGLRNKNRRGRWSEESSKIAQKNLSSFFGFLCQPADHPDLQLRGMGLQLEDLTLAWLAVQDMVESFLDFSRLRSGAHNSGTEHFIHWGTALLQPQSGWLWLNPELFNRLPECRRQLVEDVESWDDYCAGVRRGLKESLASLRRSGQIKQTRETMKLIRPILDHPRPLSLVREALKLTQRDLEAKGRAGELFNPRLAAAWRDYLLICMLACFPLRAKHWGLFTYKEDGTGYLQHHPSHGWCLVIPHSDFKNVRNKRIFTSDEDTLILAFDKLKPFKRLVPLLEFYLENAWPILARGNDFLFPTRYGTAMRRSLISIQVTAWTRDYLSQYSTKGLRIKGVHHFSPHLFRDIVATDIIKTTGSISLAANILLDSEEMVRKHYARFLPGDRVALAMAALEEDEDED